MLDGPIGAWEMKTVRDDRWQLTRRAAYDVAHSREDRDDTAKNILHISNHRSVGCAAGLPLVGRAHNPPRRSGSHGGQYRTCKEFIQICPHRRMYPRLGSAPELPRATTARARLKDRADAAQPTAQTTQQRQVNAIDSTATDPLCICRRRHHNQDEESNESAHRCLRVSPGAHLFSAADQRRSNELRSNITAACAGWPASLRAALCGTPDMPPTLPPRCKPLRPLPSSPPRCPDHPRCATSAVSQLTA